MREKQIEQKLVAGSESNGRHLSEVCISGYDGMPDRLILLPNGRDGICRAEGRGKETKDRCRRQGIRC